MSSNQQPTPYHNLGERLKMLRETSNESLAEVSDAVEIAASELREIEAGNERPSEDILQLLCSHFDVEALHASELWTMAGYEQRQEDDDSDDGPQGIPPGYHQAMMVMVDPRIMYSDGVEAVAGSRGVVLNFSQMNGPNGQPLTISRIGMSRLQAEQLMGILHQVLYDMDNPSGNKRLDSGPKPNKPKH